MSVKSLKVNSKMKRKLSKVNELLHVVTKPLHDTSVPHFFIKVNLGAALMLSTNRIAIVNEKIRSVLVYLLIHFAKSDSQYNSFIKKNPLLSAFCSFCGKKSTKGSKKGGSMGTSTSLTRRARHDQVGLDRYSDTRYGDHDDYRQRTPKFDGVITYKYVEDVTPAGLELERLRLRGSEIAQKTAAIKAVRPLLEGIGDSLPMFAGLTCLLAICYVIYLCGSGIHSTIIKAHKYDEYHEPSTLHRAPIQQVEQVAIETVGSCMEAIKQVNLEKGFVIVGDTFTLMSQKCNELIRESGKDQDVEYLKNYLHYLLFRENK